MKRTLKPLIEKITEMEESCWTAVQCWEEILWTKDFHNMELQLGMFVPCDEDGDVLYDYDCNCKHSLDAISCNCYDNYDKANLRVIFEGFRIIDFGKWKTGKQIYGKHISDGKNQTFSLCTQGWVSIGFKKISDLSHLNLTYNEEAVNKWMNVSDSDWESLRGKGLDNKLKKGF